MNRLQKKCLVGSAMTHGLLVALVVVGSAFVAPKTREEIPVFELLALPDKVVDEMVAGGGEPDAVLPQAPVQLPVVQPEPVTPQPPVVPAPQPTPPVFKPAEPQSSTPEPVKPEIPKPDDPKLDLKEKPKPDKPQVKVNLQASKRPTTTPDTTTKKANQEREAANAKQVAAARDKAISGTLNSLRGTMTSSAKIGIPGPGGQSYANYGAVLKKIYHDAWQTPNESMSDLTEVEVQITVARNGNIIDYKILKRSGQPNVDKSVQQVLERVRNVPPFPEGATDERRVFNITFNLTASRKLG